MKNYRVTTDRITGKKGKVFRRNREVSEAMLIPGLVNILVRTGKIEYIGQESNGFDVSKLSGSLIVFVFTYNRLEMLTETMKSIKDVSFVIIDDGSPYEMPFENAVICKHEGKKGFWKRWNTALEIAKDSKIDRFIFMPDDFLNIDLDRIGDYFDEFEKNPFVFNIINDHRESSWNDIKPKKVDSEVFKVGFTDCGFFCNRSALDKLGFKLFPVRHNPRRTSLGVGQQLTQRFNKSNVSIYKPLKSLAFHGDHDSVMHPEHRKNKPIISI